MNIANQMVTLSKARWEKLLDELDSVKTRLEYGDNPTEQDQELAMEISSLQLYVEEHEGPDNEIIGIGLTPELNSYIIEYLLIYYR